MNRFVVLAALVAALIVGVAGSTLAGGPACDGKKGTCGVAQAAAAGGGACKAGASCSSATLTRAASAKGEGCCAVAASPSFNLLPAVAYRVGDKTTACPKEAATLASTGGGSITYVVGEKSFQDRRAAMAALADATDAYLVSYTKVAGKASACGQGKTCPVSGRKVAAKGAGGEGASLYAVAGRTYDCPKKAERAAKVAAAAMAAVTMKYRVGETVTCCSESAAGLAAESGAPVQYVVGKESTPCRVTARLKLARMKVAAADRALAEAGLAEVASTSTGATKTSL